MNAAVDGSVCPACQSPNKLGRKFCSACGAPLMAPSASAAVPQQVTNVTGLEIARETVLQLEGFDGRVVGDNGGDTVQFELASQRGKIALPIAYSGHLSVAVTPRGAEIAQLNARPSTKWFAMQGAGFVILALLAGNAPPEWISNETFFALLFAGIAGLIAMWFSSGAIVLRPRIQKAVAQAHAGLLARGTATVASASAAVSDDPMEQLRQLAARNAAGELTADEFARRKAEVLQRI
jgi:hypothetical protein